MDLSLSNILIDNSANHSCYPCSSVPNCQSCADGPMCSTCNIGYVNDLSSSTLIIILASPMTTCFLCSSISNCQTCIDGPQCSVCNAGCVMDLSAGKFRYKISFFHGRLFSMQFDFELSDMYWRTWMLRLQCWIRHGLICRYISL